MQNAVLMPLIRILLKLYRNLYQNRSLYLDFKENLVEVNTQFLFPLFFSEVIYINIDLKSINRKSRKSQDKF